MRPVEVGRLNDLAVTIREVDVGDRILSCRLELFEFDMQRLKKKKPEEEELKKKTQEEKEKEAGPSKPPPPPPSPPGLFTTPPGGGSSPFASSKHNGKDAMEVDEEEEEEEEKEDLEKRQTLPPRKRSMRSEDAGGEEGGDMTNKRRGTECGEISPVWSESTAADSHHHRHHVEVLIDSDFEEGEEDGGGGTEGVVLQSREEEEEGRERKVQSDEEIKFTRKKKNEVPTRPSLRRASGMLGQQKSLAPPAVEGRQRSASEADVEKRKMLSAMVEACPVLEKRSSVWLTAEPQSDLEILRPLLVEALNLLFSDYDFSELPTSAFEPTRFIDAFGAINFQLSFLVERGVPGFIERFWDTVNTVVCLPQSEVLGVKLGADGSDPIAGEECLFACEYLIVNRYSGRLLFLACTTRSKIVPRGAFSLKPIPISEDSVRAKPAVAPPTGNEMWDVEADEDCDACSDVSNLLNSPICDD